MAAQQKIEARPRTWLTPVTLVLLKEESSYGYEILERLEEEFGFEQISAGSLYRTLRRTEKEGLSKSEWETSEGGAARRMYSITEEGESYLAAWAQACEQYQNVMDSFARAYSSR
jgi:PadR family transcriptional regulator, regulatory protein PadR